MGERPTTKTSTELVDAFAVSETRFPPHLELNERRADALPALK